MKYPREELEQLLRDWEEKSEELWYYNGDSDEENANMQGVAQGYENCIEDLQNLLEVKQEVDDV